MKIADFCRQDAIACTAVVSGFELLGRWQPSLDQHRGPRPSGLCFPQRVLEGFEHAVSVVRSPNKPSGRGTVKVSGAWACRVLGATRQGAPWSASLWAAGRIVTTAPYRRNFSDSCRKLTSLHMVQS